MKKNYTFLFLFLLLLLSINSISAQNKTWDGGAGDNFWSSPNNWNPNGVPGAGDWVGIDNATVVMDVSATILGIHSLGSASPAHLTINTGITLTTTNRGLKLDNIGSTLTIEGIYKVSHADGTYSGIYNSVGGNITNDGDIIMDDIVSGYGIYSQSAGTTINAGTITTTNAGSTGNSPIQIEAGASMTNNGVITISTTNAAILAIKGNITNTANGTINGTSDNSKAMIDNAITFAGGTLSPGLSIGQLTTRNGFNPTGNVNYIAEVSKTGGFLESDLIYFYGGNGNLGNLNVIVNDIGGTPLSIGDEFTIIQTSFALGGYTGTFNSVSSAGYTWTVTYGSNNVKIKVASVLPVNLTYFNARQKGEEVSLSWQTATEIENAGFEIQRSTDGKNWAKLSFVEGMGTNYESTNYTFMDNRPANGVNYYRLKQIDYDGGSEFSNIEVVNLGRDTEINIFPNPSNGIFFIDNNTTLGKETTATVFSTDGKEVMQVKLEGNRIDLSTLTAGTYYIETGTVSKQVIIE